jgi:hypothetical protein
LIKEECFPWSFFFISVFFLSCFMTVMKAFKKNNKKKTQ